ncbi:unnamed protein product [Rangifer tarandus platyrhynchus]|uniref:Uncharacterized protein n=1 Tax=Rangifer tarandus platyrhynchus TaxID=3082113 RepID=A0AC59ZP51_RANTA
MPMQEIRAQSLVWKESTCLAEPKPVGAPQGLNRVLESRSHKHRAQLLKLLKPKSPRSHTLQQKKHKSDTPTHHNARDALTLHKQRKPCAAMKTQQSQEKN